MDQDLAHMVAASEVPILKPGLRMMSRLSLKNDMPLQDKVDEENDAELRLNLNLLEERIEIAMIREASQKQQMEKYYNQRVRHNQFRTGEFVLWRNEVSKAENTGKLGPKWEGRYEVTETYETGAYKLRTMEEAEVPRTWHLSNLRKYYM
ncbi:hypothetical protein Tco_0339818 [Tanacetum coccineum]